MKINSTSVSARNYDLLKKSLDASEKRKEVIANNISNVNTKGYKSHHVTFEETLEESKKDIHLLNTNEKHIGNVEKYGEIKVETDESDSMRMDGNNVDIDNEMANLAANYLKYNALISQVNNRISMTRTVITGGR
ncbi:flagellar basal body rod protein FlgB [Clostridium sp. ZS2-4]|uniref:flagellar basal body rod protein FlgB n=1 Tax=Clostridium sp. ZS2-4 TaxID=2987703 RepID=UPI00227CE22E|nr:flagellar basal body rod protein FlgB [Clostridium sp. ZS2-4]MCY6353997.1 flagellar basal body rod protein FlgB [Clostridium sp. ZS2-4]